VIKTECNILKFDKNIKGIALGTALGAGIGVALNNFPIGLGIGFVFAIAFINKKNNKK